MGKRKIFFLIVSFLLCTGTYLAIDYAINERGEFGVVKAPQIELKTLGGGSKFLTEFPDELVVVNFWASWCPPCLKELPFLIETARKFQGRVTFLAVLTSDELSRAMPVILRHRTPENFHFLIDQNDGAKKFGTVKLPETYILNRNQEIMEKITGDATVNMKDLPKIIERLLP